ncbi:hypothetical protein ACHWQZ_G019408 [Mnemiopsis leidyi]
MTDSDPYSQALQYLEEHHIVPLFHNLTANIVYHQPADPVQYIIDEIEKLVDSGGVFKGDEGEIHPIKK